MAGHAGMDRRDTGVLRNLDGRMAVTTIEAQPTDVVLMAEGYRLPRGVPFLIVIAHHRHDPDEDQEKRDATCRREQGDVHEQVGSRAKYRHQMFRKPTLRSTRVHVLGSRAFRRFALARPGVMPGLSIRINDQAHQAELVRPAFDKPSPAAFLWQSAL